MKRYATLPVDCTALKTDLLSLVEERMLTLIPFAWFGHPSIWPGCEPKLPNLQSTFASLNATSNGVGRLLINYEELANEGLGMPWGFPVSHAIIPIDNEPCSITFFEPKEGAQKVFQWFYELDSCTAVETITLDQPILIGTDVTYIINTVDPTRKSSVMSVRFNSTDIDSLLAD